jgi:acyl carrier protein
VRQFTPQEGLAILDELLYGNVEHAIVMPVDWAAWRAAYPAIAKSPVFAEILTGGPAAAVAVSAAAVAVSAAAGIPGSAARPGPTRRDEIETTVKDCVARVLRLPSSQVPSHKRLNSLGLDSLMAAEIRHLLQGDFGLTVPLVRLLGSSTVDDVVTALTEPEPEARTAQYYPERTRGDSGTSAADVGGDGHLSFLARCRRVPLTPENDK